MLYKTLYDIPIKVYHRIVENGDLRLLEYESLGETIANSVKGTKNEPTNEEELIKIFELMQECRFDKFKKTMAFEMRYELINQINEYEIQVLKGDQSAETFLMIAKVQLGVLDSNIQQGLKDDLNIEKQHARERGIVESETKCDLDKMSAFDFYTNLEDILEKYERSNNKDNGKEDRS